MRKKVFIGCYEIASILTGLSEGFESLGFEVTKFVFGKHKFYPHLKYDIIIEPPLESKFKYHSKKYPKLLIAALRRIDNFIINRKLKKISPGLISNHDIFIFIWQPWLPESILYKKIKAQNKKIVCIHVGSDVRHISAYAQEYREDIKMWEKFFHEEDINGKIIKMRLDELYADIIYSVPDQAGLAIRPYNHFYLPISNTKNFEFKIPGRKFPKIIHAPSRTGIKGTKYILESIERLRSEGYNFEFEMVQHLPNEFVIKKLADADILIDELLLHGPGVLSIEAMFSGCAVITRTLTTNKNIFDPPVLNATPANVYEQIKHLLDNRNLIEQLAKEGYKYVNKFNIPVIIATQILADLNYEVRNHYSPSFFIDKYVSPKLSDESKSLNRKVLDSNLGTGYDKENLRQRGLI